MIDWKQGGNWEMVGTPGVRPDYGSFHVYAFMMTMGMIAVVLYSLYKFKKRGIPFGGLAWGVIFVIPLSLFGASFFGKLNADGPGVNAGNVGFWGLFAFWKAGMAIHGGIYVGLIVGLIVFSLVGRKARVSVWAYFDAIVPNTLLGQVIGRWGNFFNHEVVGPPLKAVGTLGNGKWLDYGFYDFNTLNVNGYHGPFDWLWKNTMAVYTGPSGVKVNGIELQTNSVYQMSPIFLIESLSLLLVWLLITFVIPNIGKWFGPKPWKKYPREYQVSWGWTFKHFFMPWTQDITRKTYKQVWDDAFVHAVDEKAKAHFAIKYKTIQDADTNWLKKRWQTGVALNKANNPDRYWVTKAGCEGNAYFFGWNFVRFFLEMSRPDDHLFIMYNKTLSLWIIGLSAFIGLVGMILTQITFPELFRSPGWMYEKDYFEFEDWKVKKTYWTLPNFKKPKINDQKQNLKEQKAIARLKKLEEKSK